MKFNNEYLLDYFLHFSDVTATSSKSRAQPGGFDQFGFGEDSAPFARENFSRNRSFSSLRRDTLSFIFLLGGCLKAIDLLRFELVWLLASLKFLVAGGSKALLSFFFTGSSVLFLTSDRGGGLRFGPGSFSCYGVRCYFAA